MLNEQRAKLQAPQNQPTVEECSEAKAYLEQHGVATMVEDWLRALLEAKPSDAVQWSIEYFGRLGTDDSAAAPGPAGKQQSAEETAAEDLL